MRGLTDVEDHETDDEEANQNRGRTLYGETNVSIYRITISVFLSFFLSILTYTFGQSTTRTNEKTSTNGASDSNHL